MAISKAFLATASASTNAVDIPFSLTAPQLALTNKLLFVSGHSRGNPGTSEITMQVRTAAGGGGSLVFTPAEILDIESDSILHAHMHQSLNGDVNTLTAGVTYYLRLITSGAFQVGGGILLLGNVDQSWAVSPTTATQTGNGSSISQTITVAADPGIIIDNWSGDGSGAVKAATLGETRTVAAWISPEISVGDLKAQAAYTDTSSAGTKTFGWTGVFHNRNALGILYYKEASGSPAAYPPNVHLFGASA